MGKKAEKKATKLKEAVVNPKGWTVPNRNFEKR